MPVQRVLLSHIVEKEEQYGGVERVVLDLAVKIPSEGIETALCINPGRLSDQAKRAGVRIFPFEVKGKWNVPGYWRQWKEVCARFQPDIVHSHHRFTTLSGQIFPGRQYHLLHTFHVEQFTKKWLRFFGDEATAVSRGVKKHFVRYFGVDSRRVTVIYNGVEKPASALRGKGPVFSPGKILAVVVGRLEEQKGHECLIRSFEYLPEDVFDKLHFVFVGEGPKRAELEQILKERGRGLAELAGFQADVWPYYEASDFTVLPSLWEGFGLTIIESYLCAKPVIASKVGGIPEVVKDGETGILIPPKDPRALAEAITAFVRDPQKVRRLGECAKIFAANFSMEKMIREYRGLYERLVRPSKP